MTTTTTNPFRRRGTVVVRIADLEWLGDGEILESRFPFPSMFLSEAYEWERRSGLKQMDFWRAVAERDMIGLQFLLWQALRRQPGDHPVTGHPWSTFRWEEIPDTIDLFRLTYDIEGLEDEDAPAEGDPDFPTTPNGEGSITG